MLFNRFDIINSELISKFKVRNNIPGYCVAWKVCWRDNEGKLRFGFVDFKEFFENGKMNLMNGCNAYFRVRSHDIDTGDFDVFLFFETLLIGSFLEDLKRRAIDSDLVEKSSKIVVLKKIFRELG